MVELKSKNSIDYIIMNWHEKRNALSPEMIKSLMEKLIKSNEDSNSKLIVLTSTENIFSAGADLAHMKKISNFSFEENIQDTNLLKELYLYIYTMTKPIVAVVNGAAIAGGCGLATVCDIIIAKDSARFGYTEVKIGFVAAMVMVFLKEMIGEKLALDLLLTGKLLDATEAHRIGLVNYVFPEKQFEEETNKILNNILANSPKALIETKKLYKSFKIEAIKEELKIAVLKNAEMRKTADCKEGMKAFLEKRKAVWT